MGAGARARGHRVALLTAVLAACGGVAPPATTPPAVESAERGETLLDQAEQALEEGRVDAAEDRFRRVLDLAPGSLRARVGLGQVALVRGRLEVARTHFEAARAAHPGSPAAHLGLAEVATRDGDASGARRHLERVLEADRSHVGAHARLAALTGDAPPAPSGSLTRVLENADAHPYDPRAVFEAGRLLASSGQPESAALYLERVLWLADLDPASAERAARLLPGVDPAWSERRVVPVHVFADERVRAGEGWRFRLRNLWLAVSNALDEVLGTRFAIRSIQGFGAEGAGADLDSIHAGLFGSMARVPRYGILAAFTARPEPSGPGQHKRGLAEFTGRRATVRIGLESPRAELHVLAHEILHLYGGVHVAPDLESLMNPAGESLTLDPYNLRIARAMRPRRFSWAGQQSDVLPLVDLAETRAAFLEALAANLAFRRMGLDRALQSREFSHFQAAREWRKARELDPHLGDVMRFLAYLSLADGRPAEAVELLETAAGLYGDRTPAGRDARSQADALRDELEPREREGVETPP